MFIVTAKQRKITSTRLLLLLLRESQCYNPVQTQVTALGGLQTPHTASMELSIILLGKTNTQLCPPF